MGKIWGLLVIILSLSACDSVNKAQPQLEKNKMSGLESVNEQTPSPIPDKQCPSGETPKLIKGQCEGKWSVQKNEEGLSCEYKWGPIIKCPTGSEGLNLKSVCYGTTSKAAEGEKMTPQLCEKQFGQFPISPNYELWCCPS